MAPIGVRDGARTLGNLAPVAIAITDADALVTHDAAQKPFGLAAVKLFCELRPAIDTGTCGGRHAGTRCNGVGGDLRSCSRRRRRRDRRDGRTTLGR